MTRPLFTIYPNRRVTPELWEAFAARCVLDGVPPGVKLYELIVGFVRFHSTPPTTTPAEAAAMGRQAAAVMSEAMRALGARSSPAKAAAARDNGRKGGRPRKTTQPL